MSYFKIKAKNKLEDMQIGEIINESDFATLTPCGTFVQLEYIEEEKKLEPYKVKPGIWSIQKTMTGMALHPTTFVNDSILESFVNTKDVTDKIDMFFKRLHIYKEYGIEVPKRGILLYGPAGTGKTTILNKACSTYGTDGSTAVIVWTTDKFESYQVKDFIKSFEYVGVDKIILVVEDIGGTEIEQAKMRSDSSLLSLLDNQEKTFKIPVLILATTNYPENFMGNLTNRPQRFDDKIKVGFPKGSARVELLKFFARKEVDPKALDLIASTKCDGFSPAHLKEVVIRSAIYDKTAVEVINEMLGEQKKYEKGFSEQNSVGIGFAG